MNAQDIAKFAVQVMNLLPAIVTGVTGAFEAFQMGKKALERMAAEGRDPTDEEWDILNTATNALGDALLSDDH